MLDMGCGWGELLFRAAEAAPSCYAVGVDLDEGSLAEAPAAPQSRGLSSRATFLAGNGKHVGPAAVDALIAIGSTQVGDRRSRRPAARLRQSVRRHPRPGAQRRKSRVRQRRLVGPPTPEATAPLAGRDDEFITLDELTSIAVDAGFDIVSAEEATLDEWDASSPASLPASTPGSPPTPPTTGARRPCASAPTSSGDRTWTADRGCWGWAISSCWPCDGFWAARSMSTDCRRRVAVPDRSSKSNTCWKDRRTGAWPRASGSIAGGAGRADSGGTGRPPRWTQHPRCRWSEPRPSSSST